VTSKMGKVRMLNDHNEDNDIKVKYDKTNDIKTTMEPTVSKSLTMKP
jgi:hypothetical protein